MPGRKRAPITYEKVRTPGVIVSRSHVASEPKPGEVIPGTGPIVAPAPIGGYYASSRTVRLTAWGETRHTALAALYRAAVIFPKGLRWESTDDARRAKPDRVEPFKRKKPGGSHQPRTGISFGDRW